MSRNESLTETLEDPQAELSGMTKAQLLDYAEENGVSVNSRMKKAEIIDAIKGDEHGTADG